MSKVAIRVENLGKKYRVAHREGYKTLRDSLTGALKAPFRRAGLTRSTNRAFWALDDVSFEIQKGDVVGVIGHNGAGKSTLLKILSRITRPTVGRAELRGRVGSLLEVGTGFHPELTGRENIQLNAAILGMSRWEVKRKFDEIVEFAGVGDFIDTPVKRYSSGMYMRLAFAVTAHLETEILLVDEVLAVGDQKFQKKCLGKMYDMAHEGRTVVFVSHNMGAIRSLCRTGVYLEKGRVKALGEIGSVIEQYVSGQRDDSGGMNRSMCHRGPDSGVRVRDARMYRGAGQSTEFLYGDELEIRVLVDSDQPRSDTGMYIVIRDHQLAPICISSSILHYGKALDLDAGLNEWSCKIPGLPFAQGHYFVDLGIHIPSTNEVFEYYESALHFEVIACDPHGTGHTYRQAMGQGSVFVESRYASNTQPLLGAGALTGSGPLPIR